ETYPDGEPGILYDPLGERVFSREILQAFLRRAHFGNRAEEVVLQPLPALGTLSAAEADALEPHLVRDKQSNTSVIFDERLFLKVFRRVEPGIHPEIEVGRFLTERTSFLHSAPVTGVIEMRRNRSDTTALAVLMGYVPNQGDAWNHTLHVLGPIFEHALTRRDQDHELTLPRRPFLYFI